jgi:CdiI immunity protein
VTSELEYLAKAYFHQDYDLVSGTPDDVIRSFRRDETLETVQELVTDIQRFLESSITEPEIADLLIRQWQTSYDPTRDGATYREWLAHVLVLLQTPTTT